MDVVYKRIELQQRLQERIDGLKKAAAYAKEQADKYSSLAAEEHSLRRCSSHLELQSAFLTQHLELSIKIHPLEEVLAHLPETESIKLTLDDMRNLGL